jgi:hypothetical protein
MNIANSKTNLLINRKVDLAFGVPNADFMKAGTSYLPERWRITTGAGFRAMFAISPRTGASCIGRAF